MGKKKSTRNKSIKKKSIKKKSIKKKSIKNARMVSKKTYDNLIKKKEKGKHQRKKMIN